MLVPLLGSTGGFALGLAVGLRSASARRTRPPFLAGGPLLVAHRGGAGLAPENTLAAFRQAIEEWGADALELDVHATVDGECVVLHDPTVDRTTDGSGPVASMTLEQVRGLDAGYRFTPDAGRTFPFRGKGVRVPTIGEVLEALPDTRLIVEVKAPAAQRPLFEAVRRAGAEHRVMAAGEKESSRTLFTAYGGPVSASADQCRRFQLIHLLHLARLWAPPVDAVQIPEFWGGRRIVTARLVADYHAHGIDVHVWTVNETEDMRRLLEWGVDGIVTDRPDRLADLLTELRARPPAPARRPEAGREVE